MSLLKDVSRFSRGALAGRASQSFVVIVTTAMVVIFPSGVLAANILDVYELAQSNDRTYSAAKNQFEVIKQSERQVKGLYYPTLELSYEYIDTDQTINRSDNEVFGTGESNYPTNALNLSLTQPLFRWDFKSDRKRAKAEVTQGELELLAAEQELMLRAAENYLLLLAAQDTEVMAQAELDAVGEQLKLSEKRFDIGLANTGEVNESRARHQLNQAELIQVQDAVSDRQEALFVITGTQVGELIALKEVFPMISPEPANIEAWSASALESNLALQSRAAAVDVADAEYKRQKADRLPDIDLFANFNNRDAEGSLFGGGSDVDTADVGVRAQWTLYQGGRLTSKIRQAKFKMQQAEDELEVEKSNVRRETRSAYLGVVSSIARATALKSAVDAQAMSLKAKEKGFETGSNSNLEVLDAKRDFYFVQRDFLKARYDYLLNMLNLKRMIGGLAPADLAQINSLLIGSPTSASFTTTNPLLASEEMPLIEDISGGDEVPLAVEEMEATQPDISNEIVAIETIESVAVDETPEIIEEAMEMSEEAVEATEEAAVMSEEAIEATEGAAVMSEEAIEATEGAAVMSEEAVDATEDAVEMSEEAIDATEEAVEMSEEAIEATEDAAEMSEEAVDATEEAVEMSEEAIEATEDAAEMSEEAIEVTEEAAVLSEEAVDATEEAVVMSEEAIEATEDAAEMSEQAVEEAAVLSEEAVDATEEAVVVSGAAVDATEEAVEIPEEAIEATVLVSEKAVEVTEEAAVMPEAAVGTTEEAVDAVENAATEVVESADSITWLYSLPTEAYTLQLASSPTLESCVELGRKSAQAVHCFKAANYGGEWFGLVGEFETRETAQSAAQDLGFEHAWPRHTGRMKKSRCERLELKAALLEMCSKQNLNAEEGLITTDSQAPIESKADSKAHSEVQSNTQLQMAVAD